MKRRPYLLIICSLMAVACGFSMPVAANAQSHGLTQAQLDSLAEIMKQAVEQEQIAGCSFLVAHKGETVFRKAFGYADLDSKRPFTTDELCLIASVSKPFLATALMVLVEQGKLKLDDPVEKYLPEFQGIRVEGSQSPARPMTVRHLLSHTGGFWGNKGITSEKLDLIRNFERPLDEVVKRMAEYDLVYEPGTKWIYSGAGYCVAGRVAEVALDQSLEEIVQDALFRPLGLDRTTFLPSKEVRKTLPTRYLRQGGKLQKQPSMAKIEELRFILPGGSLFTTLDELAVFGQMHLNDGVYNGKRILSEASVSEMRRLQSPVRPQRTYGLGWFRGDVSESGLADLVFHGGALGAHLRIDRKRELVCVFLVHQTAIQVVDQKNKLIQQVDKMFPARKSPADGSSQTKRRASAGQAPAPAGGEVASKWKTTGLQQANSLGGGEAAIPKSGKFRVFVLMGQSNMTGAARAAELEAPYNENTIASESGPMGGGNILCRAFGSGRAWPWRISLPNSGRTTRSVSSRSRVEGPVSAVSKKIGSFERANLTFDGKKGSLYQDLLNAVAEAKRISNPEFCGFVWKQGAADGTKKVLGNEYFDTFKQLVADLRKDLEAPDLPVFMPSYMNDEALLKAILQKLSDEELRAIKNPAGKEPLKDADLLPAVLAYLNEVSWSRLRTMSGKRPYIAAVVAAQNRAGRELKNVATLYPGDLPRISGDNAHINAEGQIMLGKFTASAVEEFYQTKAAQTKDSSIRREDQ